MRETIEYYWINDLKVVGKRENRIPFIYDKENGWAKDDNHIIMDRIMGYDASEPAESPYGIGNSDMMDRIDVVSEEEALRLINSLQ